jgi:DNA topoisomerase IB
MTRASSTSRSYPAAVDFYPAGVLSTNGARAALGLGPLPTDDEWNELAGRHGGTWFREWQHPRDRNGKWIEKGGLVRALFGSKWKTGVARKMNPDNTVTVEADDGAVADIHPKNIQASDAKAVLPGKKGRVPDAPAIPAAPIPAQRGDARTAGMRPATDAERLELGIGPRTKAQVLIDPDRENKALWGVTLDKDGKVDKSIYSPQHHAYQAALKYHRTELMDQHFDELVEAMRRDAKSDPNAAAALLMAATGMRPSSEEGANQRAGKKRTYGATTLEVRHVKFGRDRAGRDYVRFQFVGKSNQSQDISSRDPDVIAAALAHMEGKGRNDQLFTGANPDKTSDYIKDHSDPELKNKDLRTYQANMLAVAAVAQIEARFPGGPKDAEEFARMRTALGTLVSGQLGNTPAVALNSYVNPNVFSDWAAQLGPEEFDRIMEDLWSMHSQT